jgi:hypothetical protein
MLFVAAANFVAQCGKTGKLSNSESSEERNGENARVYNGVCTFPPVVIFVDKLTRLTREPHCIPLI